MCCDMVLAVGSASVGNQTLLGLNLHQPFGECPALESIAGRAHEVGETIRASQLEIPQARHTYTTLGCRVGGAWGLHHGINEHHVAIGCAAWQARITDMPSGLTQHELVRLALERSRTARQAVDLLTDLVERHGLARSPEGHDAVFLVADPSSAYLIEAAGSYWAYLECHDVRAVGDVAMIQQDWNRVSHGLAEYAIAQGWCPDDGSKIDFAKSLRTSADAGALRRWGRSTRHLQTQNGHIDLAFMRRLLGDHFEETSSEVQPMLARPGSHVPICRHARIKGQVGTSAGFITALDANALPMCWIALGPPCVSIYFPLFVTGELPQAFGENLGQRTQALQSELAGDAQAWTAMQQNLAALQERFDQEAEDFLNEARQLIQRGESAQVHRLAGLLMQNHVELYEAELERLRTPATSSRI